MDTQETRGGGGGVGNGEQCTVGASVSELGKGGQVLSASSFFRSSSRVILTSGLISVAIVVCNDILSFFKVVSPMSLFFRML